MGAAACASGGPWDDAASTPEAHSVGGAGDTSPSSRGERVVCAFRDVTTSAAQSPGNDERVPPRRSRFVIRTSKHDITQREFLVRAKSNRNGSILHPQDRNDPK